MKTTRKKRPIVRALCIRTKMIGGGTKYEVLFRKADKPSYPITAGQYATVEIHSIEGRQIEFFNPTTAIMPEAHWKSEQGLDRYQAFKRLEACAARLACRIAKRAFPELRNRRTLPETWIPDTHPSQEVWVPVNLTLPA